MRVGTIVSADATKDGYSIKVVGRSYRFHIDDWKAKKLTRSKFIDEDIIAKVLVGKVYKFPKSVEVKDMPNELTVELEIEDKEHPIHNRRLLFNAIEQLKKDDPAIGAFLLGPPFPECDLHGGTMKIKYVKMERGRMVNPWENWQDFCEKLTDVIEHCDDVDEYINVMADELDADGKPVIDEKGRKKRVFVIDKKTGEAKRELVINEKTGKPNQIPGDFAPIVKNIRDEGDKKK